VSAEETEIFWLEVARKYHHRGHREHRVRGEEKRREEKRNPRPR
jgi:hypothetical protein